MCVTSVSRWWASISLPFSALDFNSSFFLSLFSRELTDFSWSGRSIFLWEIIGDQILITNKSKSDWLSSYFHPFETFPQSFIWIWSPQWYWSATFLNLFLLEWNCNMQRKMLDHAEMNWNFFCGVVCIEKKIHSFCWSIIS